MVPPSRRDNGNKRVAEVDADGVCDATAVPAPDAHAYFHCVAIDGGFDAAAGGVIFRAATGLDANAIADVRAQVCRRLLHRFVRRGLLPRDDAQSMAQWAHGGGFSLDASVRIAAADRAGRERLMRHCARPSLALDRRRMLEREHLAYATTKPAPGGRGPQCLSRSRPKR
jgi:hypothetical protein